MSRTPLAHLPIAVGDVARTLSAAGDHRATGAEQLHAALGDFIAGRADAAHAPQLGRVLADETVLFDLIEAASASSERGADPISAYRCAALRLLDIEHGVLRSQERGQARRPRHDARSWAS